MNIRKRITIDETIYNAAVEYSKLDNRTFSALMQTAVEQMMHRYPKRYNSYELDRLKALEKVVDNLIGKVNWWVGEISGK